MAAEEGEEGEFQSTPVIANGRIRWTAAANRSFLQFQSTPVIANGRITGSFDEYRLDLLFQSTPVIANGRISAVQYLRIISGRVSIHARYC